MTSRERVLAALNHRQPDRIPVDFGSTAVTGIHCSVVAALREHYGLEHRPVKVCEPYQMLGLVEEDLQDALGVDTTGVMPRTTLFGFANENWREYRLPWGQVALVPEGFRTKEQPNGDLVIYPCGDTDAPPSGHLPANGYFFDTIIRQEPIDEDQLDPADNLEEFGPVSQADLDHFAREVQRAKATGRAVVATFGGTGFGDIALVPGPFMKRPRGIRDVAEWYMSTASRPDYVKAVFEGQCQVGIANLAKIHAVVGDDVDVAFVCGTDFGTQASQFCSPDTFADLWAPYYRRVNDWIHQHTKWKTFKHSCGAVTPLLPGLIEAGFDILNPVQCSAAGMAPARLKQQFGDQLVFWGGGVDTQHTLPFKTPADVRAEVHRRCEVFSPGGGFMFNSVHNVQARSPVANVVAMLEAVRGFRG
ncbi:methyltransferase [bacterium]|nr:methyltransferase [bacterium]